MQVPWAQTERCQHYPFPFISKLQTFQKMRIIPLESRTRHSLWNRGSIAFLLKLVWLTLNAISSVPYQPNLFTLFQGAG